MLRIPLLFVSRHTRLQYFSIHEHVLICEFSILQHDSKLPREEHAATAFVVHTLFPARHNAILALAKIELGFRNAASKNWCVRTCRSKLEVAALYCCCVLTMLTLPRWCQCINWSGDNSAEVEHYHYRCQLIQSHCLGIETWVKICKAARTAKLAKSTSRDRRNIILQDLQTFLLGYFCVSLTH